PVLRLGEGLGLGQRLLEGQLDVDFHRAHSDSMSAFFSFSRTARSASLSPSEKLSISPSSIFCQTSITSEPSLPSSSVIWLAPSVTVESTPLSFSRYISWEILSSSRYVMSFASSTRSRIRETPSLEDWRRSRASLRAEI